VTPVRSRPRAPQLPDRVRRLRPYVPGRPAQQVRRELGLDAVIKMASNENPYGPSPRAIAAIQAAAASVGSYPDSACHDLVQALASHLGVPPEQILLGNGSDEIIHYLGVAFLEPGDEVLSGHPSFLRYEAAATLNDATHVAVPLADFRFDLRAMAERLSARTRVVFIANPNNPTGTVVTRLELERFLEEVPERVIVVLDEAYFEYAVDEEYPDGIEYVRGGENVVVLRTFSKIHGLAGLRVGYGIARPEIVSAVHQVREPFNVNSLAQEAAQASLLDSDYVAAMRRANREGHDYLAAAFDDLGLRFVPSHANFILVDVARDARAVFEQLLRRGVIVRTDPAFGLPTFLRVTIGTPDQNRRFLRELADILRS
jgi:histidinol-phosphate aminotransferase